MARKGLFAGIVVIAMIAGYYLAQVSSPGTAWAQLQEMQEVSVRPNVPDAGQAAIPSDYGRMVGVEAVGKATMLWFEGADGTIRRVHVSFWEEEISLDDQVIAIPRR